MILDENFELWTRIEILVLFSVSLKWAYVSFESVES